MGKLLPLISLMLCCAIRCRNRPAGPVGYRIRGQEYPSLATTPEASDLQALLRQMVDAQVTHATMEVSSHALAWYRTVGCDFDTVVLTNITEDHLDFHQTFEHYLGSKSKLFAWLGSLPVKRSVCAGLF